MKRGRLIIVSVLAGVLVSACGVPAQNEPHAVGLPRRPLNTAVPGPSGAGQPGEVAEVLCLVRDGHLVQTVRRIAVQPSAQQQLAHLVAGPTETERDSGLATALTGLSLAVSFSDHSGVAVVDVTEADESNARSDETIAYGQIVCTLTSRADVGSVVFTRKGERLEVPRADGSLSDGPMSSSDYADLIAPD